MKEAFANFTLAIMFSVAIGGVWVAIENKATARNIAGSVGAGFVLTLLGCMDRGKP